MRSQETYDSLVSDEELQQKNQSVHLACKHWLGREFNIAHTLKRKKVAEKLNT